MMESYESAWERILKKCHTEGECIIYPTASTYRYAYTYFRGKQLRANRVSWMIANRKEIPPGMVVLHACDVTRCINPKHLSIGTQADNIRDCISKGRKRCITGVEHPHSKLNPDLVRQIRTDRSSGLSLRKIATKYGVDTRTIADVSKYRTWKEVSND